ncbi:hypothetical protein AMTR_s00006p00221830 [Amborella trichopoda]|uniref:Uncharacterized protein n=1 Tax=Amborella trichopoda TaxID=13333 RepID=W1PF75_AMBTC|nr:hypothetical protein AMTR_s00006p00221830 [Amborella trichopoda]
MEEEEQRHAFIYELSEEDVVVPLTVYGERDRASMREIMYMSMHAWEIMERLAWLAPMSWSADAYKPQLGKLQLEPTEMTRQLALMTLTLEQVGGDPTQVTKAQRIVLRPLVPASPAALRGSSRCRVHSRASM